MSFFPATASDDSSSFWCSYDDKKLQAYSAVMHFTGAVASLFASYFTQRQGRTRSMVIAGTAYIAGSICQAAAKNTCALAWHLVALPVSENSICTSMVASCCQTVASD